MKKPLIVLGMLAMMVSSFMVTQASLTKKSSQPILAMEGLSSFKSAENFGGLCTLYLYRLDEDGNVAESWTEHHYAPSEAFCDWLLDYRLDQLNNPISEEEDAPEEP